MKDHGKKINSLIDLKPRSRENKNKRLKVIIHAGDIYNNFYNIYKSKYNKKIDNLSAKNKKSLITNNQRLVVIIGNRLTKNKKNKIKNHFI